MHKPIANIQASHSHFLQCVQQLSSHFLLLGKQHKQSSLGDFHLDCCQVSTSILKDDIYLVASMVTITCPEKDSLVSANLFAENKPVDNTLYLANTDNRLEQKYQLHQKHKIQCSLLKQPGAHMTPPVQPSDIAAAGKWAGFRLSLQQPEKVALHAIHRATWQESTSTGDVRHFECEWRNYKYPVEEEKLISDMLTMHQKMQQLSKDDAYDVQVQSMHNSCTRMNQQIKQMSEQQSRNIAAHTVQQQEALEPNKRFSLTPLCNLCCVGNCFHATLQSNIQKH